MAAYAATTLIRTAHPRLVARPHAAPPQGAPATPAIVATHDERPVELVGRPLDRRFAEWRARIAVNLAQTTFFLSAPDSWR